MKPHTTRTRAIYACTIATLIWICASASGNAWGQTRTYTLDADFDEGSLISVNHDAPNSDQLQLNATGEPFDFIWVAASARGTIVKIDTRTGAILGEYLSAPDRRGRNPSRTTIDANGNVWAGNRAEADGGRGSVVHVGLLENGQCVDRNGNGTIETSTGLGDIRPWTNPGGVDDNGGVSSAEDECIVHYVRTSGTNVRTIAVDAANNVWIGGYGNRTHELYDQNGVAVPGTQFNVGKGGYGGLLDGNGVLWSASLDPQLVRHDPSGPTTTVIELGIRSYGLGIDASGNIWQSNYDNDSVQKIHPSGAPVQGPFNTSGASGDRGVAVTPADGHVWVANSWGNDVSRLDNNGVLQTVITVGNNPTGVAVDALGKVWVTNLGSNSAMRIDPFTNTVDLTVDLGAGAGPYNYSDMTGSTLTAPPQSGTWTVVYDSAVLDTEWGFISWSAAEPGDSDISVTAASSTDNITFGPPESVTQGVDLTVADGQYLKVSVSFTRASTGETPVLYDLMITGNRPPDCSEAYASVDEIWPPNHKMVDVEILGVTDPDGDVITITITGITQDEPVETLGDGSFEPDGAGVGTSTAQVRAERSGTKKVPGNGRFYTIWFMADDGEGGECGNSVTVCVPHDQGQGSACIDDGQDYDSTMPSLAKPVVAEAVDALEVGNDPNPFNPTTTIRYALPEEAPVRLTVYNALGQVVRVLVDETRSQGRHSIVWDGRDAFGRTVTSGVYIYRLQTDAAAISGKMVMVK